MNKKFLSFIFARGGSKGVKHKNIKLLNGKPLIVYSIEKALKSGFIDRVVVSTDSEEISHIAHKNNAEVIKRPKSLAGDKSAEILSWKQAIKKFNTYFSKNKPFISLPATSPLRNMSSVLDGLKKFLNSDYDIITSISESKKNPFSTQVLINDDNTISTVIDDKQFFRRQDTPKVYDISGSFYIGNSDYLLKCKNIYDGKVGYIKIDEKENLDIDTMFDFHIASYLLRNPIK